MRNYFSFKGAITFFDDTDPVTIPAGASVFRRTSSMPRETAQIIGDFDTTPIPLILAAIREEMNDD